MLKIVIFDLDGTLYNYEKCHYKALRTVYDYTYKKFGIEEEKFYRLYEEAKNDTKLNLKGTASCHNRIIYFKNFLQKINKDIFKYSEKLYNIYWHEFFNNMELYPNVIDTFIYLKKNDIKIAISSNLTTLIQIRKIRKLKINKYINYLLTSEELGVEKPNKNMFINILNYFNVANNEVIFVGNDYKNDIIGANNIGIKSILINENAKKDCICINSFEELLNIIKNLNNKNLRVKLKCFTRLKTENIYLILYFLIVHKYPYTVTSLLHFLVLCWKHRCTCCTFSNYL